MSDGTADGMNLFPLDLFLADLLGTKALGQALSTSSIHWLAMALVVSFLIPH